MIYVQNAAHKKALATPYPNTTAKAPKAPPATTVKKPNDKPAPKTPQNGQVPKNTGGNNANAGAQNNATKRKQQRKRRSNNELGSGGEHITDYYYVKRMKSRSKINHNGALYEYYDSGHNGIDHVWHSTRLGHKYRVTDSKATNALSHKKLMTPKAAMMALKMGLDVYLASDEDDKVKRSVGNTKNDGVQMSHLWIAKKIRSSNIVPAHSLIIREIAAWERVQFKVSTENQLGKKVIVRCPYDRSLVTITGDKFDHHAKCKGRDKPRCTRTVTAHGIKLEFVLPNDMLAR